VSNDGFKIETTVAMLRKNRGGDVLRVALATVGDGKLLDVRQMWCQEGSEEYSATKKGFAVSVRKLDELIAALNAARSKALELGWLDEERKAA